MSLVFFMVIIRWIRVNWVVSACFSPTACQTAIDCIEVRMLCAVWIITPCSVKETKNDFLGACPMLDNLIAASLMHCGVFTVHLSPAITAYQKVMDKFS